MGAVVDNTVLSNLAFVDRVDLLQALFGEVFVPVEVRQELLRGVEEGYTDLLRAGAQIGVGEDRWLRLRTLTTDAEEQLFRELTQCLGFGEAACLAMAHQRGWLVLTDDARARREARRLHIPISGSIGLLVLSVERQLLSVDDANDLLRGMIAHRFRSPVEDLRELLDSST